jgi:hypothetical protein
MPTAVNALLDRQQPSISSREIDAIRKRHQFVITGRVTIAPRRCRSGDILESTTAPPASAIGWKVRRRRFLSASDRR